MKPTRELHSRLQALETDGTPQDADGSFLRSLTDAELARYEKIALAAEARLPADAPRSGPEHRVALWQALTADEAAAVAALHGAVEARFAAASATALATRSGTNVAEK